MFAFNLGLQEREGQGGPDHSGKSPRQGLFPVPQRGMNRRTPLPGTDRSCVPKGSANEKTDFSSAGL